MGQEVTKCVVMVVIVDVAAEVSHTRARLLTTRKQFLASFCAILRTWVAIMTHWRTLEDFLSLRNASRLVLFKFITPGPDSSTRRDEMTSCSFQYEVLSHY
jgi:hypothetical protein